MRLLIDGYNLLHVTGAPTRKLGPDGLRKVRHRFLNDLAAKLDPLEAHLTTIVFDAAAAPEHLPKRSTHKGMTILFAVDDPAADDLIERLIRTHSAPKTLTVVSSDRRIRDAASRRKAKAVTADAFWDELSTRRRKKLKEAAASAVETKPDPAHRDGPDERESDHWLAVFGHLEDTPEAKGALKPADFVPTDEDVARIAREVAEEDAGARTRGRKG